MIVHLDTHVALWMVSGDKRRLRPVSKQLSRASLFVSPLVVVEMEVLREIGRLREPIDRVVEILRADYGVEQAAGDVAELGRLARGLGWTRDPFDRLIVAHAMANRAMLLTADETIRANSPQARWGT